MKDRHRPTRPEEPRPLDRPLTRREALRLGAGALAASAFVPGELLAQTGISAPTAVRPTLDVLRKAIPSTGEELPVIGMGTWQTFMVDDREEELAPLREVLRIFVELGGRVLDSSPMYDPAERVAGDLADELGILDDLWVATKVWTEGREEGMRQMEQSLSELRRPSIELMQVHNLVDVEVHLDTLEEWKEAGRFRYIGVSNTSAARYPAMEALIESGRLDFIQVNYSMQERASAERVLPAALDHGVAVLLARPFGGGGMFSAVQGRALPAWAAEFDASAWSQFFLKYIVSHPAVTCAIPATSNPDHMRENMGACVGRLPDAAARRRMEELFDGL